MKKSTIILATILLFPAAVALARGGGEPGGADFGGHDSGSGGGNSNNAGGNGGGGNGTVDNSTDTSTHLKDRGDVNRSTGGTAPNRGYGRNGSNNSRPKGTNGSFHHFNSFNGRNAYQPAGTSNGLHHFQSIPQSLRRMGVTSVPRPRAESTLLSHNLQHSTPGLPSQGAGGRPFSGSMVSPRLMNSPAVKSQMAALAGNKGFNPKIGPPLLGGRTNQYIWHSWNGYNYCNYYDRYGNGWWGWNCGAGFFWTQYYCGNWWWYDPWWGNWCYWWGGNWWWQDPGTTTVYVYNNGSYTPTNTENSNDYGGPVYGDNTPQGQPPADNGYSQSEQQAPKNEDGSVDFVSRDGKVKVAVTAQGDAFLYNLKNSMAKPVYLDTNVEQVKFSAPGNGPTKILLLFKDGTFETLNANGTVAGGPKT